MTLLASTECPTHGHAPATGPGRSCGICWNERTADLIRSGLDPLRTCHYCRRPAGCVRTNARGDVVDRACITHEPDLLDATGNGEKVEAIS